MGEHRADLPSGSSDGAVWGEETWEQFKSSKLWGSSPFSSHSFPAPGGLDHWGKCKRHWKKTGTVKEDGFMSGSMCPTADSKSRFVCFEGLSCFVLLPRTSFMLVWTNTFVLIHEPKQWYCQSRGIYLHKSFWKEGCVCGCSVLYYFFSAMHRIYSGIN